MSATRQVPNVIVLMGCTAAGKSAVALELADQMGAEILSVDSMQVYRGMDIGTAKPTPSEQARVRHHLLDVADPSESFSVARFTDLADRAMGDIQSRNKRVLAVAGTPLYLMGLIYGMFDGPSANEAFRADLRDRAARSGTSALHAELAQVDPVAAERIHRNDLKRIERALEVWHLTGRPLSDQQQQWAPAAPRFPVLMVGIRRTREDTSHRINARVRQMLDQGLFDEVRRLADARNGLSEQARQAVGYAQVLEFLEGRCSQESAIEKIKIQTRRLAKHQRTWFRRFPEVLWEDAEPTDSVASLTHRLILRISGPKTDHGFDVG